MSLSNMAALAAQPEIPTGSELLALAQGLHERKSVLIRRRANAEADKRNVLGGHVHTADLGRTPLSQLLEQSSLPVERASDLGPRGNRDSPLTSPATKVRNLPLTSTTPSSSANLQGKARSNTLAETPPPSHASSSSKAAPGSVTPSAQNALARPRIKVKREGDREASVASAAGSHALGESEGASSSVDVDWDDEGGPSRPGRAFKRKKQRTANALDNDSDMSLSETESPEPNSAHSHAHRPGLPHIASSAASHSKLKLNPTTQTAPPRRDSIGSGLLRKASGVRGDMPLTPYQAQIAAQWELPRRTLDNVVPKRAPTRSHRTYPTKPDEVNVDFAAMDWRERDRERDRLDSEASGNPGSAVVKESTAAGRARDRKQDQVPLHTFQQWAEGWFRTLTEEDLAWLSSKSTDLEPFQTPALGRHYTEVWAEEEAQELPMQTIYLPGASATIPPFSGLRTLQNDASKKRSGEHGAAHTHEASPFDPRKLRDENLTTSAADDARAGPMTERLLSAVLPQPPLRTANMDGPDGQARGSGGGGLVLVNGHGSGNAGPSQDLSMFEQRLANELKAIELLGKEQKVDWSERTDDEVSVALRTVQRQLREQTRVNEQRKAVLFQIAMERMAYQEYLGCLASVEREIESGWLKRQTQIKKSMQAQKKKKGSGNSTAPSSSATATAGSGNAAAAAAAMGSQVGASGVGSPAPGTPGATGMAAQGSSQGAAAVGTPGGPVTSATHAAGGGPIKPQFSEALIAAMHRRLQLKYALEPLFASKPLAKLTPTESIYKELDGAPEKPTAERDDNKEAASEQTSASGQPSGSGRSNEAMLDYPQHLLNSHPP